MTWGDGSRLNLAQMRRLSHMVGHNSAIVDADIASSRPHLGAASLEPEPEPVGDPENLGCASDPPLDEAVFAAADSVGGSDIELSCVATSDVVVSCGLDSMVAAVRGSDDGLGGGSSDDAGSEIADDSGLRDVLSMFDTVVGGSVDVVAGLETELVGGVSDSVGAGTATPMAALT